MRTEIQIGGAWTDVTADTYTRDPITISRGTADEASSTEPSSCSMTLNNRLGKYSPRNPMSPYYGLIGRNTPVRVSVAIGDSALPTSGAGSSDQGATSPDRTVLRTPTGLDVRVEVTMSNWTGNDPGVTDNYVELCGKGVMAGNQQSWALMVTDAGRLVLRWSTDGAGLNAGTQSATIPVGTSGRIALRAVIQCDNGAGGWTVTYYTAPALSGPWVVLGTPFSTTSGTTNIYSGTGQLTVGQSMTDMGYSSPNGYTHGMELRNSAGTLVANPLIAGIAPGTTSFTDGTGNVWTTRAGSTITNRKTRFVGEVSAWPSRWDVSGRDVWVPIEAAGMMRRLGQGVKALDSTLRRRIPSGGPLAYWPCEEGALADQFYSPIDNVRPLRMTGFDVAAASSLAGSSPLPTTKEGGTFSGVVPPPATTLNQWHTEFIFNYPKDAGPAVTQGFLRWAATGTVRRWEVQIGAVGINVIGYNSDDVEVTSSILNLLAFGVFNAWCRCQIFAVQNGSNVDWTVRYIPIGGSGVSVTTSYAGTVGRITGIKGPNSFNAGLDGTALGHLSVLPVAGSTIYNNADIAFTGETAGVRATRLTTEEGIPFRLAGATEGQTRVGPQTPETVLTLLGEAEQADGGILYEDRDRLQLVYRGRSSLYNQRVALALDYLAKGEVPPPLEPTEDDQKIRNDVTVVRDGGSSSRIQVTEGPLSVAVPPAGVGIYDESVTLSLYSDAQTEGIAGWLSHLGTVDEARYPTITVWVHAAPHLADAVLALDIGDRLTIANPPAWLPPDTIDQHVRGYTEVLGLFEWSLTYNCAPASPWQVGVEGDPVYARADTAGSALASSATATATTLSVATTVGPVWVTAAPNEIADPGFEQGTGTWACTRGTSIGVVTWDRSVVHSGTGALRITRVHPTDTGTLNIRDPAASSSAAPGQTWVASAWVYSGGAAANNMRVGVVAVDSGGIETVAFGTAPSVGPGVWVPLTAALTMPAGTVGARLAIEGRSAWTVGEWWVADDVRLARTDILVGTDMPAEFPFPVTVGGEVVNVHGISGTSSPQTFYVNRSQNGIVKAQTSGTDLRLTYPTIAAL
ncbi:carbohydrate binding domain-containing protein [Streptomyces sp. NPDC050421]|uniref:carbohydrate binding domain-containing protein n=1 Tax=Streptomyces sp. NPDC050421 TaxID=3365613 RepID=UPI003792F8B9